MKIRSIIKQLVTIFNEKYYQKIKWANGKVAKGLPIILVYGFSKCMQTSLELILWKMT